VWEKFLKKLGRLKLDGVFCNFHFCDASKEQYEEFKKAFKIKAKVPDYLSKKDQELYEVGEGNFQGLEIKVYGPHFPNPNYEPEPEETIKKRRIEAELTSPTVCRLLWEAVVKDIMSFDREKMEALFASEGLKWDWFYGQALRLFSKAEATAVGGERA